MTDRYNFSLTTFSPSGKLVQIEYALNAVAQGITCVGIKGIYSSLSFPFPIQSLMISLSFFNFLFLSFSSKWNRHYH